MVKSGELIGTTEYLDATDEVSHKSMSLYPGSTLLGNVSIPNQQKNPPSPSGLHTKNNNKVIWTVRKSYSTASFKSACTRKITEKTFAQYA
jgi:hypothetical protein